MTTETDLLEQGYIQVDRSIYTTLPVGSDIQFLNTSDEYQVGGYISRIDNDRYYVKYRNSENVFQVRFTSIKKLYRKKTIVDINIEKLAIYIADRLR